MRPNKLDGVIAEEIGKAYACLFAVWEMIAAGMPKPPTSTLKTIFLSEDLFWSGRIICNAKGQLRFSHRITSGSLILDVDEEYAMHVLPAADFHKVEQVKAREVWLTKQIELIKRKEGAEAYILLVPLSDLIFQRFVGDASTVECEKPGPGLGRSESMTTDSGAKILLWLPPEDRIAKHTPILPSLFQKEGIYHRMMDILRTARRM